MKVNYSLIEQLYNRYNCDIISREQLNTIINKIIINMETDQKVNNLTKLVKKELLQLLSHGDDTESMMEDILNGYINHNVLDNAVNYNEALNYLQDISKFLKEAKINITPYVVYNLLQSNNKFNNLVELVVNEKKDIIIKGSADILFDDEFVLLTISSFCDLNKIDINPDDIIFDKALFNDPDQYFLQQIRKPLLTFEEEQELFARYAKGDNEAKNILIERNMRLVVSIARKFIRKGGSNLMDLVQEGSIGLMKAVDKFEPNRQFKFSTYATWWIRHDIMRSIVNNERMIRLPMHFNESVTRIHKIYNHLKDQLNREPSLDEMVQYSGIDAETIKKVEQLFNNSSSVSINDLVGDSQEAELEDFIEDPSQSPVDFVTDKIMKEDVNNLFKLGRLTPREIRILKNKTNTRSCSKKNKNF